MRPQTGYVVLFICTTVLGIDRYVMPNGLTISPYDTWAKAASNIQIAVDVALPGETVWVTNGVYGTGTRVTPGYSCSNRVVIVTNITVRSVNGPDGTTILGAPDPITGGDGTNAVRGVYMSAGLLHGFTISNGYTMLWLTGDYYYDQCGGGVNMRGGNGMVSNCVISGNSAILGGGTHSGNLVNCTICNNYGRIGGAYQGTAINCVFSGNSGTWGGVYSIKLYDCVVSDNIGIEAGGVGFFSKLYRCTIIRNSSTYGGAASESTLNNCLIISNTAGFGGGTRGCIISNCTIIGNNGTNSGGGTYYSTVINSIVWNNTAPSAPNWTNGSYVFTCTTPLPPGVGNISTNPVFLDASAGNYRLAQESPCINKGTNDYAPMPFDLDGKPRIAYGRVDMGAYEWEGGLWCSFDATPIMTVPGTSVVFSGTVSGTNTHNVCYWWDFQNDGTVDVEGVGSNSPTWIYPSLGEYSVSLLVSNEVGEMAYEHRTNYITVVPEPALMGVLAALAILGRRRLNTA